MPVIEIWGLPERLSDATLPHLTRDLCKAVADIEELDISESDVSVFYPLDQATHAARFRFPDPKRSNSAAIPAVSKCGPAGRS